MSRNQHPDVHYINTGFPYTVTNSFMDLFEGLSYIQIDFALAEALQDQQSEILCAEEELADLSNDNGSRKSLEGEIVDSKIKKRKSGEKGPNTPSRPDLIPMCWRTATNGANMARKLLRAALTLGVCKFFEFLYCVVAAGLLIFCFPFPGRTFA